MSPFLWFLAWLIALVFPVSEHWIKNFWRYLVLGLFGLLFGFITIACAVIDPFMILLLVFFKLVFTAAEWIFAYMDDSYDSDDYHERKKSIFGSRSDRKRLYAWLSTIIIIVIILFSVITLWQTQAASGVNNAVTFDQMLDKKGTNETIFQNEIPDNMLRLTTDELAKSIAARSSAHFGSVQVGSAHITIYKGRLVWVVTMIPLNLWGDNTIKGLVVVDANNPETDVEIVDQPFSVGESLMYFPPFYTGDIQGNAYWGISTADAYGRATITINDKGEWKYVLTATSVAQWSFVALPKGVYVYNKFGQVENFDDMSSIPDWVTQRYDEGWLESMISAWGGYKRGSGFDVWAGGLGPFATASPDRVEISDDTRWIVDPDTNKITALVAVDFIGSAQTMAGMFKTNSAGNGITYYDMRGLNIKSGLQAQNIIEGYEKFVPTNTITYEAQMPLLYLLNGKYAWFVPVYSRAAQGQATSGQETLKLVALGIVDATNLNKYSIVLTNEQTADGRSVLYQGADLVKEAKRRFLGGSEQHATEKTVSGTLDNCFSYISSGNTIYVLAINGTNYSANTQYFNVTVVSRLEQLREEVQGNPPIHPDISIVVGTSDEFIRFPD